MTNVVSVLSGGEESHPEQQPGEKFLGYMDRARFKKLEWTTKREGQIVYDDEGGIVPQGHHHLAPEKRLFPVFAERNEIEEARRSA